MFLSKTYCHNPLNVKHISAAFKVNLCANVYTKYFAKKRNTNFIANN